MKYVFLLATLMGVTTSMAVQAKDEPKKKHKQSLHDEFTGQGYGMSGCGLGSVIWGPKPGMIQAASSFVNVTFGSQTFGISSATSNCDIPESGQQAAAFIEVNKEIVRKDAARGQGETVAALAEILQCKNSQELAAAVHKNFGYYFGQDVDSYETVRRLLNTHVCNQG